MLQPELLALEWLVLVQVTVITDARGTMNAPRGSRARILARSAAGAPWFQAFAQTLGDGRVDAVDAAENVRATTTDDVRPTRTPAR